MDIVILGSGNVAAVLGRKFVSAGHRIVQVVSRNAQAATALAYEWDTESANYFSVINRNADVYLVAVSDSAIAEVINDLQLPGKVIAHTAASVPKEILKTVSSHYGVLYPLQSLRKEMRNLPDVPLYFDGIDQFTIATLKQLAESVSFHQPVTADDAQRVKLHVAAVVVSNLVNHLYVLAEEYCRKEGISFKQLLPLIGETALRIKDVSPKEAQTGPAVRHDVETIQKHLQILEAHPDLRNIYSILTNSIQKNQE
jgi:predicted short-subunit dehydrogenase-like oxidoreductase (DUF2520 family)